MLKSNLSLYTNEGSALTTSSKISVLSPAGRPVGWLISMRACEFLALIYESCFVSNDKSSERGGIVLCSRPAGKECLKVIKNREM